MFGTRENESSQASTSVLLAFAISKGVKEKSRCHGTVATSANHSPSPLEVEFLLILNCIANWFQWEGVGWGWIAEANRTVYERALVEFGPSFMTHSASNLPWPCWGLALDSTESTLSKDTVVFISCDSLGKIGFWGPDL